MRRRNLLGEGVIEYVFSAQTTSTSVTACITSVTINLTSTANGQNTPYELTEHSGITTSCITGDTSITIKFSKNSSTSSKSGSITLKQTNSNKILNISVSQNANSYQFSKGTGYSTEFNLPATSGSVDFGFVSKDSCGSNINVGYTKNGDEIISRTLNYTTWYRIYYSANPSTTQTRYQTMTLMQSGGGGKHLILTFTQQAATS